VYEQPAPGPQEQSREEGIYVAGSIDPGYTETSNDPAFWPMSLVARCGTIDATALPPLFAPLVWNWQDMLSGIPPAYHEDI
jgi:hypothetical protein